MSPIAGLQIADSAVKPFNTEHPIYGLVAVKVVVPPSEPATADAVKLNGSADLHETLRAELVGNDRAAAHGVEAHGHAPVLTLCGALVAAGHDPATSLDVYRADTLCLRIASIGQAARLKPSPSGVGFVRRHFRLRAAPPIASTAPAKVSMPSFRSRPGEPACRADGKCETMTIDEIKHELKDVDGSGKQLHFDFKPLETRPGDLGVYTESGLDVRHHRGGGDG